MNNQVLFRMLEGQNIDNKYYLNKLLGAGGFGGVYLADEVVRDRLIRTVALKLIIINNHDKQLDELIFSTTLEHPNLINCYTCGECNLNNSDFLYLLMEKADYSLEDELKKGKLSEEKVKQLLSDIANGLDYLHSQNPIIVHRDLKPGNILRVGDKWKISDFGLVRSLQGAVTQTATKMGSMGYAPPEAYEGKISTAWDIWSLGVVIYESLTGKLPFESDSPLQLMKQITDLQIDWNNIPEYWRIFLKKCIVTEMEKRWTANNILIFINSPKTSEKNKTVSSPQIINNLKATQNNKLNINSDNSGDKTKSITSGISNNQSKSNKAVINKKWLYFILIILPLSLLISFLIFKGNLINIGNGFEKAIASDPPIVVVNPNNEDANISKEEKKTISDYNQAIELNPNDATAYYNRGLIYNNLGEYEKAIADYSKAIELDPNYDNKLNPNYANAYFNNGLMLSLSDEYEKAITNFTKAIELDPNRTSAYYYRGSAYYYLKEYEKAFADYSKAIELNPNDATAYDYRGFAYYYLKEYEKAITDYTKAIELDPNDATAYYYRGLAYHYLEKYENAFSDYTKAIELDTIGLYDASKISYICNERGYHYYHSDEYEKAITNFTKAIELDPNRTSAYYYRGSAYDNLKEYEKAIADYTKAIELHWGDDIYNIRGLAYEKLQKYEEAMSDYIYTIYLVDPNDQLAKNHLKIVQAKIKKRKKGGLFFQ